MERTKAWISQKHVAIATVVGIGVVVMRAAKIMKLALRFTFALGTVADDLVSGHFALGYPAFGVPFGSAISNAMHRRWRLLPVSGTARSA